MGLGEVAAPLSLQSNAQLLSTVVVPGVWLKPTAYMQCPPSIFSFGAGMGTTSVLATASRNSV